MSKVRERTWANRSPSRVSSEKVVNSSNAPGSYCVLVVWIWSDHRLQRCAKRLSYQLTLPFVRGEVATIVELSIVLHEPRRPTRLVNEMDKRFAFNQRSRPNSRGSLLFSPVSRMIPALPHLLLLDADGLNIAVRERGQDRPVSERKNGMRRMGLPPASIS